MDFSAAEDAIRAFIEAAWPGTAFADTPLVWENEVEPGDGQYMAVNIEGTFADKSPFGSVGLRMSVVGGIIFYHSFVPIGRGKKIASGPVDAMGGLLELTTISTSIKTDGANPPSPTAKEDRLMPSGQPGGSYYLVSGSVPFVVIGNI